MKNCKHWAVLTLVFFGAVLQATNAAFAQARPSARAWTTPDPETERLYYLENVHFGDLLGHATNNPSTVDIHARNTSGKESGWMIQELTGGAFKIYSVKDPRLVLQASSNSSVVLAPDRGLVNNQLWQKVDLLNGTFKLRSKQYTTKVLDASAGTRGKVQLWDDLGNSNRYTANAANQRWKQIYFVGATVVSGSGNGTPKAGVTITSVTVTKRPKSVSDVNCSTDSPEVLADLLGHIYSENNRAEMRRFMDCIACSKLKEVLSASSHKDDDPVARLFRINRNSALDFMLKCKLLECKELDFSYFTDEELNSYFKSIPSSQFCAKVNSYTAEDYVQAVNVYFQLKVDLGLPQKFDYINPFFIPFPSITGFNDADEQTMLRIMNCLPRKKFNDIVKHFSYREFDYKFDGSENTQFQQLYDRHNPERYAKWTDDASRVFLTTKTCNEINRLDIYVIRDLILNMFEGHTDEAEESAIIKVIDCLPASKIQTLITLYGTNISNFKSEFQGRNEQLLQASFRRKGIKF